MKFSEGLEPKIVEKKVWGQNNDCFCFKLDSHYA